MYIDILNSDNSKLETKEEADLIRLALMMSDKVGVAGRCSFFLNLKNFLDTIDEKEKLQFLRINAKQMYKDQPASMRNIKKVFDVYYSLSHSTNKSKNDVLRLLAAKNHINKFQNIMMDFYRKIALKNEITDILPFAPDGDGAITIRFFDDTPERDVKLGTDVLEIEDAFIIFDKIIFEETKHAVLKKAESSIEESFNDVFAHGFLWNEMMHLDILHGLTYEHFKIIRENYISGTEPFRSALVQVRDIFSRIIYSKENIPSYIEAFQKIKQNAVVFEKIEKENALLNNLIAAGTVVKKMKISFAVTSYRNLILLLERLNIINNREGLYIMNELSHKIDTAMSIPFLIAEKEGN